MEAVFSLEAIGINQMNDDGNVNREVTVAIAVYILRVSIKEEEYQNWVRDGVRTDSMY